MIQNVKKYLNFLCKHKIDANQFLFCYLVFLKDKSLGTLYNERFKKFGDTINISEDEIQDLISKKLIEDLNIKLVLDDQIIQKRHLEFFYTTNKFSDGILIDNDIAAEEFAMEYPGYIRAGNGENWIAKAKLSEAKIAYMAVIKNNLELHLKILEHVNKVKEETGGYAKMSILNYVQSKAWEYDEDKDTGRGVGPTIM